MVYGEGREPIQGIPEPTVIFMINRSLPRHGWSDEDVYRATRCGWVIGEHARNRAVYALGASNSVVRGEFRIDNWINVEPRRWSFDGVPVPELNVVGKSILRIKSRQGNSSPVRLFLDGIPEPS